MPVQPIYDARRALVGTVHDSTNLVTSLSSSSVLLLRFGTILPRTLTRRADVERDSLHRHVTHEYIASIDNCKTAMRTIKKFVYSDCLLPNR